MALRVRQPRLPIATFLSVVLVILVAAPMLLVGALGLGTAASNTSRLLNERSQLFRDQMVTRTRDFLAPAQALPGFVAERMELGELDAAEPGPVSQALRYAFGAAPQLSSVAFASDAGWVVAAYREADGQVGTNETDWRSDAEMASLVADAKAQGTSAQWGRPIYITPAGVTAVNFIRPVYLDGHFTGCVIAAIRITTLSRFAAELGGETSRAVGMEPFILYDREYVIAHRNLVEPDSRLSPQRPIPLLGEVGDPVLAQIWRPEGRDRLLFSGRPGHILDIADQDYAFFYEPLNLPSQAPWLVGGYLPLEDLGDEVFRLLAAGVVAVVALAAAVLIAIYIARRLSRPATELALASERVARIELDAVPTLKGSHLKELDAAARAFNSMVGALRLFSRYAPAKLVRRLIIGGVDAIPSERRTVTVLFTDIAGFTAAAETMPAEAAAALLNAHHTLVIACVEEEGGTVDKLIGDGLLAFWNAPDPQTDHADRALRAAVAIRAKLRLANREAATPVCIRLGIHTGTAVVGNIGSPTRLSYTIVGDTVNVASRVEELNRMLQPEAEAAILLSGETVRALTGRHELSPVGSHVLRGRNASVELFTVPGEPSPEHLPPASEAMHVDDPDLASADSLLAFWFAPGTSERWFVKDPAFDAELGRRFGTLAEAAARGELDHWAATPRGALALVILLDQLPRNLHRGRPEAFTQDAKARAVAAAAIEEGHDALLTPPERIFLYLPFEHSEDRADLDRAVELFTALGDAEQLDYAQQHRSIIHRFGRYPHRNAALGRRSTDEEVAFLAGPNSSF